MPVEIKQWHTCAVFTGFHYNWILLEFIKLTEPCGNFTPMNRNHASCSRFRVCASFIHKLYTPYHWSFFSHNQNTSGIMSQCNRVMIQVTGNRRNFPPLNTRMKLAMTHDHDVSGLRSSASPSFTFYETLPALCLHLATFLTNQCCSEA